LAADTEGRVSLQRPLESQTAKVSQLVRENRDRPQPHVTESHGTLELKTRPTYEHLTPTSNSHLWADLRWSL